MKKFIAAAVAAPIALAGVSFANAADAVYQEPIAVAPAYQETGPSGGVRIGYLDCAVGSGFGYVLGSAKEVDCVFNPVSANGVQDRYTGAIRKVGVDVGYTAGSRIVWAVFAPTAGYHGGSLGGVYDGISAEATVGAGVGANVLVGGTAGSVHLQTVSVQGQLGLNVAAAGTSVTLNPVN